MLPLHRPRHDGPLLQAEPLRLHRLPDVDVGVAHDQHVRAVRPASYGVGDPALLRAGDEVVHQHADAARRSGPEVLEVRPQVVDAAEVLHDHALEAQVLAPDLLDQLRVVAALDVDPAGPCHAGLRALDGHRARRRPGRGRRALRDRRAQGHRLAVEVEAGAEREHPAPVAPVLQRHRADVAVDLDDLAAEPGGGVLDDHALLDRGVDRAALLGPAPVVGQHVGAVAVVGSHAPNATARRAPVARTRRGARAARRQARGSWRAVPGGDGGGELREATAYGVLERRRRGRATPPSRERLLDAERPARPRRGCSRPPP